MTNEERKLVERELKELHDQAWEEWRKETAELQEEEHFDDPVLVYELKRVQNLIDEFLALGIKKQGLTPFQRDNFDLLYGECAEIRAKRERDQKKFYEWLLNK